MAFPVPKDVRTVRDFELVLGQDELLRQSMPINNLAQPIDVGEWVKPVSVGGITKAAKLDGGNTLAAPAMGARVSWTRYRQNDASQGQADAIATQTIDIISGTYQAKTKLFNAVGTFAPGLLLVAVYDGANNRGYLDALPLVGATVAQLQAVVGRVVAFANGVLHYESPGL